MTKRELLTLLESVPDDTEVVFSRQQPDDGMYNDGVYNLGEGRLMGMDRGYLTSSLDGASPVLVLFSQY